MALVAEIRTARKASPTSRRAMAPTPRKLDYEADRAAWREWRKTADEDKT